MRDSREVKAATAGAVLVGTYMVLVLATGRIPLADFSQLLFFYLRASFSLWVGFGLFAALLLIYRHRPKNNMPAPSPFVVILAGVHDRWERDRFISMVWPPLLFAVLIASFNAFKQMVLPIAGFHYDPLFAEFDRALFLGTDPWKISHSLFGSPGSTWFIDRAYHAWFVPMSVGVIACAWLPNSTYKLRNQYLLSWAAIWIGIGSVLAYLMPSAGPCYYENFVGDSSSFDGLKDNLLAAEMAVGSHLTALSNQSGLLRLFGGETLAVGAGISAMPSVHNGLAILFAIAAWRINRTAGWLVSAYAVLIWIGSIHLGWHYAIDGLFAAVLTFGIWRVAGLVTDRLARSAPQALPEPALA
ncbi:MAG: phosphatase PAP2 family protein [Sphingomonas sp.]|nr:phosphatase PAP2 family protein [Sphingomonas sp.]